MGQPPEIPVPGRSRTRGAVLRLLFAEPSREHHVRGIARVTGEAPANVHRETRRLAAAGVLTSRRLSDRVAYRLDPSYAFYEELRAIVDKTVSTEAVLRRALLGVAGISLVSELRSNVETTATEEMGGGRPHLGDGEPQGALELLVVGFPRRQELRSAIAEVAGQLRIDVCPHVFEEEELHSRVLEGDEYVKSLIARSGTVIIGDEAQLRTLASAGL